MTRKYQGSLVESNANCVNAGALGMGCTALINVDEGCSSGTCPFFKTKEDQEWEEQICAERCARLGVHYETRSEVINGYDQRMSYYRRYSYRRKR